MFNFEGWPQQEEANRICNQNTCSFKESEVRYTSEDR